VQLFGSECTLISITLQMQLAICLVLLVTSGYKGQHAAPNESVRVPYSVRDWSTKKEYPTLICVIKGGSNMTGTDLCVNKPHCAAAVRP